MNTSQLKKYLTPKNIGVSFVVVIIIAVVILTTLQKPKEQAPSGEAPLAAKCRPVPGKGKQTYDIKTDVPKDLQIVQVKVDPIDVKHGDTQKITVKVKDKNNNSDVSKATVFANISTDSKYTAASVFTLRKQQTAKDDSSLLTTWEGSWVRDDDYCNVYQESIIATNDKGDEAKVDLSFK